MPVDTLLTLSYALGGVGIFMMGMIVMTEGLRSLAGDAIRKALMRFTKTSVSGAVTGAVSTAILQSSSATTVAAVGFVGAGLLAFPEALGIIFGANIGTTITGWMVALLGFKFQLGTVMLPLILLGAMLKLFFRDKIAAFGYALAGFGLIFVGIEWMQEGMSAFEGIITPENLPADSLLGRLQLLGLGIIATVITQSSSAGVAATLTMLYAGAINFEQAAALVIGMDVGTTFTAAMAAIGGSTEVKRTGFSHVIYNFFTGFGALLLITPYIMLVEKISPSFLVDQSEIALVAFHTIFNILGVIIVLPFTHSFARMMEKIIKTPKQRYRQKFDTALLEDIPLALSVVHKSLEEELKTLLLHINFLLGDVQKGKKADLDALEKALNETQNFIDKINLENANDTNWQRLIDIIHTIDHLQRLFDRCEEDENRALFLQASDRLAKERTLLTECNEMLLLDIQAHQYTKAEQCAKARAKMIKKAVDKERDIITSLMANDTISIPDGTKNLEALRWLQRSSAHIARIVYHLEQAVLSAGK